jgi:hypothetical protein
VAEYAAVVVLVLSLGGLAGAGAPTAAGESARESGQRARAAAVEAAQKPSNALEWLGGLWQRAGEIADRRAGGGDQDQAEARHGDHSPTGKEQP